jgi:hypothetical protein
VRVGDAAVSAAALRAQIRLLSPGHIVYDPPRFTSCVARLGAETPGSFVTQLLQECRAQHASIQQEALGALITEQWLIGAARERGLDVPAGSAASKASRIEAELRESLSRGEPKPTNTDLVVYYQANIAHYEHPEQRGIYIVEHIPSRHEAQELLDKAKRRGTLADIAVAPIIALRESISRSDPDKAVPTKRAVLRAIFAAKPHTLVGPVSLNEQWCLFEVTSVSARTVKPLSEVKESIEQQLSAERRRHTLARFIAQWRKRWMAKTDCSAGYVVQKCRQYRGRRTPEKSLAFD